MAVPKRLVWLLVAVFTLKLLFVVATAPYSNLVYDSNIWMSVGELGASGQNAYLLDARYNWLPPWFLISTALTWLAPTMASYYVLMKLFLLVADLLIAWMVWKRTESVRWTAAWTCNPIVFAAICIQGQVDVWPILLLLTAAFAATGKELLAGLAVAMKHYCLFVSWAFLAEAKHWKELVRKAIVYALPGAIITLPFLLSRESIVAVIRNAVMFGGANINNWGINFILGKMITVPKIYLIINTIVLAALIITAIVLMRKRKLIERLMLAILVMAAFSSSFEVQHLVWPIAFGIVEWRRFGRHVLIYSVLGSLSAGLFWLAMAVKSAFIPFIASGSWSGIMVANDIVRFLLWIAVIWWLVAAVKAYKVDRTIARWWKTLRARGSGAALQEA